MSVVLYCLENYWLIASIVFVVELVLTKTLGVPISKDMLEKLEVILKKNGDASGVLLNIGLSMSLATDAVLWPVFFPKYVYKTIRYGFTKI